jgi:hypothetical protein
VEIALIASSYTSINTSKRNTNSNSLLPKRSIDVSILYNVN